MTARISALQTSENGANNAKELNLATTENAALCAQVAKLREQLESSSQNAKVCGSIEGISIINHVVFLNEQAAQAIIMMMTQTIETLEARKNNDVVSRFVLRSGTVKSHCV